MFLMKKITNYSLYLIHLNHLNYWELNISHVFHNKTNILNILVVVNFMIFNSHIEFVLSKIVLRKNSSIS